MSLLIEASRELGIELSAWSIYDMEDENKREECVKSIESQKPDILLLHSTTEDFWKEIIEKKEKMFK